VSALARHARRVSVVLVGEDSLEANVGHLAALTGGNIFVASGKRVDDALKAAMASLRAASGIANAGEVRRSGAIIAWRRTADAPHEREPLNDALVALG
jgi:formylmethanofuran:tetrahydromethanopterin formyltransferase